MPLLSQALAQFKRAYVEQLAEALSKEADKAKEKSGQTSAVAGGAAGGDATPSVDALAAIHDPYASGRSEDVAGHCTLGYVSGSEGIAALKALGAKKKAEAGEAEKVDIKLAASQSQSARFLPGINLGCKQCYNLSECKVAWENRLTLTT